MPKRNYDTMKFKVPKAVRESDRLARLDPNYRRPRKLPPRIVYTKVVEKARMELAAALADERRKIKHPTSPKLRHTVVFKFHSAAAKEALKKIGTPTVAKQKKGSDRLGTKPPRRPRTLPISLKFHTDAAKEAFKMTNAASGASMPKGSDGPVDGNLPYPQRSFSKKNTTAPAAADGGNHQMKTPFDPDYIPKHARGHLEMHDTLAGRKTVSWADISPYPAIDANAPTRRRKLPYAAYYTTSAGSAASAQDNNDDDDVGHGNNYAFAHQDSEESSDSDDDEDDIPLMTLWRAKQKTASASSPTTTHFSTICPGVPVPPHPVVDLSAYIGAGDDTYGVRHDSWTYTESFAVTSLFIYVFQELPTGLGGWSGPRLKLSADDKFRLVAELLGRVYGIHRVGFAVRSWWYREGKALIGTGKEGPGSEGLPGIKKGMCE